VIADRTACDVRYSYKQLSGIAMVSVSLLIYRSFKLKSAFASCQRFSRSMSFVAIRLVSAKMSGEVNKNCPNRKTAVQLSTPYIEPERHNA